MSCKIGKEYEGLGDAMINTVFKYVKENRMLINNDKVVLGVSGGADSVCLFFVFLELKKEYNLDLYVVHVNHGIRGEAAKNDAIYVEQLCKRYGINFILVNENVRDVAKQKRISEEEAGRNVRYEAFHNVCQKLETGKIAIAHNSDDRAETVLFNLFRGSGLKGLTGISPVRHNIIRPLLCVSRGQIEEYLNDRNITYCTDLTNLETDYTRNKIRLKVLPYISDNINVNVKEHIVQTSVMIEESLSYIETNANDCFHKIVKQKDGQYSIRIGELRTENVVIQKVVIRKVIEHLAGKLKDVTSNHVNIVLSLLESQVGKRVNLPYSIVAKKGYEDISLFVDNNDKYVSDGHSEKVIFSEEISTIPGNYFLKDKNLHFEFNLMKFKKNLIIPQNGCTKWFDYDKINNTVALRTRREGDYLQIDPKGSNKKLKAFFIDQKIPKEERDEILLLADGKHIMWVVGERISEAYKIDENTKNILMVKLYGGNEDGTQD